jgi:hypothetical protein
VLLLLQTFLRFSLLLFPLLLFPLLLFPLLLIALLSLSFLLLSLLIALLSLPFLLFPLLLFALLLFALLLFPLLLIPLLLISLLLLPLLLLQLLTGLPKHDLSRARNQGKAEQKYGCAFSDRKRGSNYREKNGLIRQTLWHRCRLRSTVLHLMRGSGRPCGKIAAAMGCITI